MLFTKYCSGDQIKRMRWAEHVARVGDKRDTNRDFMGRRGGKSQFRRSSCREADNIKMDLQEVRQERMGWIYLAYDRDRCWVLSNPVLK